MVTQRGVSGGDLGVPLPRVSAVAFYLRVLLRGEPRGAVREVTEVVVPSCAVVSRDSDVVA